MSPASGGGEGADPVPAPFRMLGHSVATTWPVDRLLEELSGRGLPFAVPVTLGRMTLPDGRPTSVHRVC